MEPGRVQLCEGSVAAVYPPACTDAGVFDFGLNRDRPTERLGNLHEGIAGIRSHAWFRGFDWPGVVKRSLRAPIIPEVRIANGN